ncbi:MAG: GC-type dockerin domain-anchored protein [Phycisphaerales bacterium]
MPVKQFVRWAITLCVFVMCCVPTRAQGPQQLDLLSSWGGPVLDFQRVGNIGYAAVGQRLVILDMTDEANVHEIGSVLMTGKAEAVAVRGDYAYVGGYFGDGPPGLANQGRLIAVNISNPSAPVVVWRQSLPQTQLPDAGSVQHLCFYNNLLFAHNRDAANYPVAYDLTNPAVPAALLNGTSYSVLFRDTATSTNYQPRDFQIVGNLAYVATRRASTTIAIFNMQPDPLHPTYVGRLLNTEAATGHRIAVEGNKALVQVQKTAGLFVRFVDVTNPASPALMNSNDDFGFARDVAIQGNLAFVADWAGGINTVPTVAPWSRLKGLAIFDITNLASPVLVGTYNTDHSSIREVVVVGNRAYALCDGQGLVVLDISNPTSPTRIGGYFSPGQLRYMTKVGNLLYVADAWNGFTILDVSNPDGTPTVIGVYRGAGGVTNQQHRQVVVRDNLAYLAAGYGGIQIVDVSSPASPTMVFHYPSNNGVLGHVESVELVGNVLHTGQEQFEPVNCGNPPTPGFYNYDVSNPLMVTPILGSHGCQWPLLRLATMGGVTFSGWAAQTPELYSLDTSSPAGPVSITEQPWGGEDMEVHGNYLYTVNAGSGACLSVADVTDPYQPVFLGTWIQPNAGSSAIRAVGVSGSRAFLGYIGGIYVLDVSNPAAPSVLVQPSDSGGASDIVADGNLCYSTYFGIAPQNPAGALLIRRLHVLPCNPADIASLGGVLEPDHQLTVDDLVVYLAQFFGNNLAVADLVGLGGNPTPDGQITVDDLVYFLSQFFSGCP